MITLSSPEPVGETVKIPLSSPDDLIDFSDVLVNSSPGATTNNHSKNLGGQPLFSGFPCLA
ncbi:hypothetical protein IMZ48_49710 [Candidatus Bathyarchaeota archaeon]|nr:hypothetical protein [Candidatus Bathyarchaeota archaeon]